jgi:hypothetical protein
MIPTRIVTQPTGMVLTLGVTLPQPREEPLEVLLARDEEKWGGGDCRDSAAKA